VKLRTRVARSGRSVSGYISQFFYLLFPKTDEERAGLAALGVRTLASAIPENCRWAVLSDLQGRELTRRYSAILDKPAATRFERWC
jgi:hypothetical protein